MGTTPKAIIRTSTGCPIGSRPGQATGGTLAGCDVERLTVEADPHDRG
jgi:hypothetical protein